MNFNFQETRHWKTGSYQPFKSTLTNRQIIILRPKPLKHMHWITCMHVARKAYKILLYVTSKWLMSIICRMEA